MGILDKADHFKGVPLPQGSEFVKGMRSSGNAAMGSLNNLAGAVGQKLGAEEFATGRFAAADQHMQDAAASAPRVTSMRDVHSVGDFGDFAAGVAGGIVPVGAAALGAGLLTGGGAVPAIAAGTAVMAPVDAGDIVGRMRQQGRPVDLPAAALGGTASAALQNVLPGLARARLGGRAGQLPGGPLAAIPEQALLAGGAEAGKQVVANPSAPLEMQHIGDAAAGGALFGVPIAGMSALGGARGQIGAAADAVGGKVKDAAQFVGDKAKGVTKATTEAADAGAKRVEGMEIPDALAGIFDSGKAKARDMLDKIAASEDVVGDISKFAGLQGEKLKQAILGDDNQRVEQVKAYAQELGDKHPAVRDWLMDTGNHAKQAAVATAKMAKDTKDTAMDHLTRFADSVDEWSNARKFKRTDGNKYAGGETVDAETRRVDPSPDGVVDAEVRDVTIRRLLKSEDDSGIRKALGDKLIPELLKVRPELIDAINDPKQASKIVRDLHRGFAPLIKDLANGRRPSSDTIDRLIDLAGPAADRLIEVAHSVVGDSTDPAKTREFFSGLNQFTQVRDSSDSLVQTLRKNLSKGQERMTDAELRQEAELLSKWRDDKRPIDGPNADPEAVRLNYMVRKHLDSRYGAKSEAVLAALEKDRPEEANQIERARKKYDEDGQPIDDGVEDGFSESGSPGGQMRFFGGGAKGKDLFVHPEDDPGKKGYPGAAMQRLAKVQAMYPEATVRFVTASEMGPDHPWIEGRYDQLVKIGNKAGVDGDRYAMKQLDRFGVIATERATHGTDLTFDELDAMKFDRHKYDAENSPAALFTGHFIEKRGKDGEVEKIETVLDAVKITKSMMKRFKGEYAPGDDIGEQARTARVGRMFIEGVAAAQTYLGKSFDIPDNTLLGRFDNRDVTWADVKKLDRRSAADRKNDDTTKYLEGLRKAIMATEDKELRKALIREGFEADAERQLAKNVDLTREDSRKVSDEPGTGYTSDVGIPISRVPPNPDERSNPAISRRSYSRKTKDDFKTGEIGEGIPGDMGLPNLTARMKRIGEVNGELGPIFERMEDGTATAADRVKATALRKELAELSKVRDGESTGRTEIDPFGPTGDALRGRGQLKASGKGMNVRVEQIGGEPNSFNAAGGQTQDPFLPQRINDQDLQGKNPGSRIEPRQEPPPVKRRIGTDREYGNKSWPALRKAAAEAAKKFSDPAWDSDHAGFMLDGKRYSVQQERPGQWYVKNDEGDIIHSVGKAAKKPAGAPPLDRRVAERVDALAASEDYSSLNTRPKVDAFLDAARKRFDELRSIDGDLTEQQSKALGTLYGLFGKGSTADLASFYDGVEGGPPNPKAVAAKKAALLERARSGDESLIEEVKQHTDAVGLQNAVLHLARKGDVMEANTARAISALNERIGELVREQPQQAYDMLKADRSSGKKYSLESTRIHEELERPGFAATHDSPIRHEGKFDWRAHSGKGEGNASFGAGTYLSTADGVHRNYKNQFTAKVSESPDITSFPFLKQLSGISRKQALDAANAMVPMFATSARELREAFAGMADALDGVSADALKELGYTPESAEDTKRIARLAASAADADFEFELGDTKSPTYHVSVDIPPEKLLDWNKPLSEQSEFVQKALAETGIKNTEVSLEWDKDDGVLTASYGHPDGSSTDFEIRFESGLPELYRDGEYVGQYTHISLAKQAADASMGTFGSGEAIYNYFASTSQRQASDYLQSLGILGHKYNAAGGKNDAFPNYVIYDDSKISTNYVHFDKSAVDPNRQGPINRKEVGDYINRTLGNSVRMAWANLGHAGEFERVQGKGNAPTEDIIRLSVHAMNPLSTAFHESMHAFIQKLNDQKHGKIVDVLFKAGESAPVLNQLRAWMAERGMGEKALAQLKDPEERAAYMYQAWADGKLNVGDQTKTVLGKIADFIRSVLGIWSNDQRALHIMEYFHSGDFAKNMANRDQVYKDLMVPGRNKAIETARKMAQPILELGENLGVAGAQRLRDTGIPALRELADQMKLHTVAEGDDPGFVPAARAERTRVMNKLAADLKDFSAESVQAALESLQQKSNDPIKAMTDQKARGDAFTAKVVVRKLLDDMYGYMTDAGVKVADLGVGKDYFPRQYDVSYISSHQQEFKNVLDRHGVKNADKVLSKIMVSEGAEFTTVVTDKPGMQHLKPRDLAFIPEAELAPFMRKNLTEILNGYVTQATRRAEWAKRFGDDGKGVNKLIAEAQRQGATPDDVDSAWKFVRAVDGTLGDTINPEARRLFGNMIVYQNVRLLPLMIFSSVVDPMGIMVRGGTMADSFAAFKRGVSEIPKNFKKNPQDDAATKFAASIGVIDDTTLVHTLGALYSQGMVGDTGRKINDTLFRYNLAEQFNTSMRVSATEAAMGFLARHADGTASPHSRRWLSELGLEPNELTFDANGRVKATEADGLTPEQSAKVKAAINRWVDGAVLRPDAADKPIWMSDPHWSLISHLKQFTYAFHETILKRVAHEYQNGNYTPAMALMSYVPMMIAADMAKGLIQGGGEEPEWKQNWGMGDYVAAGVERAGLLGVGQFGVDMLRDAVRGGTGVGALAGPTVEQFAEAARMLGGRESFGQFVLKSMPANALYSGAVDVEPAEPKFVD